MENLYEKSMKNAMICQEKKKKKIEIFKVYSYAYSLKNKANLQGKSILLLTFVYKFYSMHKHPW